MTLLDLILRVFDFAFGDLHFLLAREQGDLAHLLEIHPHGVIQNIEARLVVFLLHFGLLDAVTLRPGPRCPLQGCGA